jgi:hypothetical protein
MHKDIRHVALTDSTRVIVASLLRPGTPGPDLRQIPSEPRLLGRRFARGTREEPLGCASVHRNALTRHLLPSTLLPRCTFHSTKCLTPLESRLR